VADRAGWRKAAASGAAVMAVVATLAGCSSGPSAASGKAAANQARGQVVPATTGLYQRLLAASDRSVSVVDGSYVRCSGSSTKLHYSVSLRLYPFSSAKTSLGSYARQVTIVAAAAGWKVQQKPLSDLPSQAPFVNPATLPATTMFYEITKHVSGNVLVGTLFVYPGEGSAVSGSITVNGTCFDAGSAAATLTGHLDPTPLPTTSGGSS
jgi:hypothetical protein